MESLALPEDFPHKGRFVRGDLVHAQVAHRADVLCIIHCPHVDAHAQVLGFLHPFRMLIQNVVMVVDAGDAFRMELGRGDVAAEVLDRVAGGLLGEFLAEPLLPIQ